jgi:D-glycero-beta-D-manno-heptose-7-phosphate kinase
MIRISNERLNSLKKGFEGKRIAIIGDMMLDCYFWGEVKRISPEAPVPVVEVGNEFYRFGGAANVALNILKLGGIPVPIGVIGYDSYGTTFTALVKENKIISEGLLIDDTRPTTAKTRVIAHNQHIVRIDKECKDYINARMEEKILGFIKDNISSFDAVIFQDYNKGVLTPVLIRNIVKEAHARNILVTVDPKFSNFFEYKDVTVFKPNRKEAEDVMGTKIRNEEDLSAAGFTILEKLNAKYVLLTLGEEGIAVFEKDQPVRRMPTKARKVADVSGAGDTVISTLTMALTAGADIVEASYLANYAGGIVCEDVGIVPIDSDKLFQTIIEENK